MGLLVGYLVSGVMGCFVLLELSSCYGRFVIAALFRGVEYFGNCCDFGDNSPRCTI